MSKIRDLGDSAGMMKKGSHSSMPVSANVGDLFFDTTNERLMVYKTSGWISTAPTPDAPTSVVATQLTATTASIAFTAPTTGPTVNSYIVTSSGAHTATGASSPITVTGLTFGSSYTFTVQSVNDNGAGNASTASASITMGLPTVTGGTLASDSTYYYRTFTSSSNLVVAKGSVSCDVLMIAGGGSGGGGASEYYVAAGGGAGGYVYSTSQSLSPTSYVVTVGAGGTKQANEMGGNGSNSGFTGLTTAIGGGGGAYSGNYGLAGGSSGGSTHGLTSTAPSVAGQGFRGGAGGGTAGAGGGGAGAVGGDGSQRQGGSGGAGLNTWSTWATATGTGVSGYYAGGGGGGHSSYYGAPSPLENGGAGGGGRGSAGAATLPTAGTTNTGSGGGGAGGNGNLPAGIPANGGSGIIIVRYLKTAVA